ncbi:MAG: class I SAM-dependent methyltransferase [Chloroflexi bacterium]|nr:MAG: class I SAM-dependent methyltransferase [Chloroflexota bacterium]
MVNSMVENIPCNLCGAQDSEPYFTKGGLTIVRCTRCGLVYVNPRLKKTEVWKRYNPDYFWQEYMPAHRAPNGEFVADWHRQRAQPVLNLLQPYYQLGTLLEVGCAAGFFLKIAEETGWKTHGVEIMSPAVAYARDTLGLNVFEGTLEQAQFGDESFDAVVMIETVEHLLDPAETVRQAYRLLRPGGAIWIAVPNLRSIMLPLLGVDWSVLSPVEHLYYFTEDTLRQMLKNIGFRSVQFFWRLDHHHVLKTMNPYNTHRPGSLRSRLVRWGVLTFGRVVDPLIIKMKRTDRLMALAVK